MGAVFRETQTCVLPKVGSNPFIIESISYNDETAQVKIK